MGRQYDDYEPCDCPSCRGIFGGEKTAPAYDTAPLGYGSQQKSECANAAAQSMDRDYALAERAERLVAHIPVDGSPLARIERALDRLEKYFG